MAGNDALFGNEYDDVLWGGPGKDTAFGRDGLDRCAAERRNGCER